MSEHNGRLEKLEDHAVKTEGRLSVIEDTQRAHGSKLDSIATAVNSVNTALVRLDARPVTNIHAWIKTAGTLFTMCAILGALATWFVVTMTSAEDRVTAVRLDYQAREIKQIRDALGWRPSVETKGQ